jgi:quercetin dioxygenase-like cupin family protein
MNDPNSGAQPTTIPPDDTSRTLVNAGSGDHDVQYVSVAGGVYAILVTGDATNGRYTVIDMRVPSGGGPPPHRHDFEEMFTILEGELEFTFRGETSIVGAGRTVNIPANAPHFFRNASSGPARMLCVYSPAGQDEFFMLVGDRVDGPTSPPPELNDAQKAERKAKALELAPRFRTELLRARAPQVPRPHPFRTASSEPVGCRRQGSWRTTFEDTRNRWNRARRLDGRRRAATA